ncbi:hypothetical protein MNBD_GAMMA25-1272 [hydrothermal vent metagenome]|uniref:Mut7-C RNAse domain-containing protein n=1 Tax=hydrothermal vent metagenome TaxID=652676 RepID=A0A3B1AUU7_9ZZZZ
MFQRLGNWLRAAGYDTVIEQHGRTDYALLQQALKENRLLITRDKKLLEHRRAPGTVVLLDADGLDDCARELGDKISINWLHRPFSRCMVCNTALHAASADQLSSLPKKIQSQVNAPVYCPVCNKLYWDGGHVERMRERLQKWQVLDYA